ncbi:MAG TPA: SRPBCC family protein, partial [Gammaproteobacteria bacterium]|nr:SRPBCC family protein [Gammaproteobacteria bacterium]
MTTISKSALVPYTPAEMFALVSDIEAYPQFLPWCRSAGITARNGDEVRATIELSKGGVEKAFTTCNRQHKN